MINRNDVMNLVDHIEYWRPEGTYTTVCCLIFKSGFTELGWSQCADSEDFDPEKGKEYALECAVEQSLKYLVWDKARQRCGNDLV